mmetsp:Transcript_24550/g.48786  ORF Transcript_24550/g.48786 Transcript_24550/m.48786 type:complete len:238 (+) Transcript_24550:148-861(+)|eukprot:CAMPEP_0182453134 /NCGR_PEP_ID=MMETSP1319-20130603/324_1 /TAXON_ID=172717 /ORGANISM="Bolidomonas pacifica, Strain RCC208" /LENGTH=237 /DNA_ID=CAMNT_0024651029 /DNA_START=148 /DNA_END=861 /DNA_ORIENTATION=+
MIHRVSTRLSRQHLVIPRRSFFGINIGDITSDRPPPKPLLNKWEPEEWTVTTDRKIGGKSKAACEAGEEGGIVFKGNTSLDLRQESRASKSGFCSLISPPLSESMFEASLALDNYKALWIKMRKWDNRNYTVNLYPDSYIGGEIYQGYIIDGRNSVSKEGAAEKTTLNPIQATEATKTPQWMEVELPFENFMLTKEGRVSEIQRKLDGIVRLKNVGVLLADADEGEFRLDIMAIEAR